MLKLFQLAVYKTDLMKQAEKIVLEEFPKKVLEFNNLLEVSLFLIFIHL